MTTLGRTFVGVVSVVLAATMTTTFAERNDEGERIRELDRQCMEARAAKLKPLQEAMVETCVKEDEKPRDYCERFYADYGWGSAAGGFRNPRFFENIPECEAAFEARKNRER